MVLVLRCCDCRAWGRRNNGWKMSIFGFWTKISSRHTGLPSTDDCANNGAPGLSSGVAFPECQRLEQ